MKPEQKQTESKLESQKLEANCVEIGRYFNRLQESYSIVHQMRMLGKKEWQRGFIPSLKNWKAQKERKRKVLSLKSIFIKNKIGWGQSFIAPNGHTYHLLTICTSSLVRQKDFNYIIAPPPPLDRKIPIIFHWCLFLEWLPNKLLSSDRCTVNQTR